MKLYEAIAGTLTAIANCRKTGAIKLEAPFHHMHENGHYTRFGVRGGGCTMSRTITTKHIGPTERYGARILAKCGKSRYVMPWIFALNTDENHEAAAKALHHELGNVGDFEEEPIRGLLPDKNPDYLVFIWRNKP